MVKKIYTIVKDFLAALLIKKAAEKLIKHLQNKDKKTKKK